MKRIKKLTMIIMAVMLLAGSLGMPSLTAYAASTATFSVSGGGTATQGKTVSITVSVSGSDIMSYAKVSVNYDANVLEYQSGADSGGSGRVSILFDCGEGAKSASRTLTFKAKNVGTSSVSLDTAEATTMGSATVMPEMMSPAIGGAASVTVAAPVQASSDSHIGKMEISPGKLNPAFNKDVFKYSVEVENNVKKVTVSASAAHEKAVIASVKGGSNLKVGQNTITVTCKAENGNTSTYTIIVTRKEGEGTTEPTQPSTAAPEEPETPTEELTVNINGVDWLVSQNFKENAIPSGFEEALISYQGTEVKGAKFSKGDLYLIYLTDMEKKNGSFFMYYPGTGTIEEMVKLSFMEGTYVIFLSPEQYDGVPEELTETSFAMEDKNLRGWQLKGAGDTAEGEKESESLTLAGVSADISQFYFVYGMNQEGNTGWYTIDTQENTIQRFALFSGEEEGEETVESPVSANTEPTAELTQMEKKVEIFQFCILGMSALMVILIVVTVMLGVKCRRKPQENSVEEESEVTEATEVQQEEAKEESLEEKPEEEKPEEKKTEKQKPEKQKAEEQKPEKKKSEKKKSDKEKSEVDDDLEFIDLDDM